MVQQTEKSTNSQETAPKLFLRRGEDFESLYANHTYFNPSEWDLKITFGEVDADPDGTPYIAQHTAISMPWLQAKIMYYFLGLQLGVHEMNHGKIPIPPSVTPPEAVKPEGEDAKIPNSMEIYELISKRRIELLST